MFKTDETVRFGQILSARTLRYGKFNEYIIIIDPLIGGRGRKKTVLSQRGSTACSAPRDARI